VTGGAEVFGSPRAPGLFGVTVREYRAPGAGTLKPSFETYAAELFGWPH